MRAVNHRGEAESHSKVVPYVYGTVVYIQSGDGTIHYVRVLTYAAAQIPAHKAAHVFYVTLFLLAHTGVFGRRLPGTLGLAASLQ